MKRFLKAFKNIGRISFNQKQFNCITVKSRNQQDYRRGANTKKTTMEMLFDKKTVSMRKTKTLPILPIFNKLVHKKAED